MTFDLSSACCECFWCGIHGQVMLSVPCPVSNGLFSVLTPDDLTWRPTGMTLGAPVIPACTCWPGMPFGVHRNPTHTDQYLHLNYNYLMQHNRWGVRTLIHRAQHQKGGACSRSEGPSGPAGTRSGWWESHPDQDAIRCQDVSESRWGHNLSPYVIMCYLITSVHVTGRHLNQLHLLLRTVRCA